MKLGTPVVSMYLKPILVMIYKVPPEVMMCKESSLETMYVEPSVAAINLKRPEVVMYLIEK